MSPLLNYDPILLQLVLFTLIEHEKKIAVPITVSTDGMLVSGYLVSAVEYFHGLAAQMEDRGLSTLLQQKAREAADEAEEIARKFDNGILDSTQESILHFLYLRDAYILPPAMTAFAPGSGEGFWWRCRLNAVTGFAWNAFVEQNNSEECPPAK